MSLAIDIEKINGVLLADRWHEVVNNSFDTDAYEFMQDGKTLIGGGQIPGVSATGATWLELFKNASEDGGIEEYVMQVCVPFTSILGVRCDN